MHDRLFKEGNWKRGTDKRLYGSYNLFLVTSENGFSFIFLLKIS